MADNITTVQTVKFYEFGKNSLWLGINFNKQWNSYSLDMIRKFTYTKNGETKEGYSTTYLKLTAAKALVDQLLGDYQLAKNLQDNQGVEMYEIFCLIFKTIYIIAHRSSASNRKRLDR